MRITQCNVSPDTKQLLSNTLSEIQSFSEQDGMNSHSIRNAATATLCVLLRTETTVKNGPVIEHVQVVGTQGRYLLFLSSNTNPMVPSFVLMTAHTSRVHTNSINVVPACTLRVFRCGTADPTYVDTSHGTSIGCGTRIFVQLLQSKSTCNRDISRAMQPFFVASRPRHSTTACDTHSSIHKTRRNLAVCVTQPDGACTGFLPVISEGLLAAQSALRSRHDIDADIIIAQNHDLCVKLILFDSEFRLCLYHTEDLLSSHVSRPVPIVTLSHKFHAFDCIVEEKHDDKFLGHVTGLLAVVQELLRRNVIATPIRFMGSNRTRDMYSGMHQTDICSVLSQLHLVSDNIHIARTLNHKYKTPVVRYMDSSTLLVESMLTPKSSLSNSLGDVASYANEVADVHQNNFQLHHCNALLYASAHHNRTIQGLLNHGFGMDLQEITTAIQSGIAFCNSCAYDQDPVKIDNDTGDVHIHVINGIDFSVDYMDDMTKILTQSVASFSAHDSLWSKVRHNIHANQDQGHGGGLFMVECHVAASGVCFFRRVATDMSRLGGLHGKFVGAAFVTPSLLTKFVFEEKEEDATPLQTQANPGVIRSPHAMISVAMELASHDLLSPHALIQNATETLLLINAMCVHNNVRNTRTNMKTYGLNRKYHKMLRQAWLHTNMFKAARMCGGTGNPDFYRLYSHLSKLSLLPMDTVNFWVTMPYV